MKYSQIKYIKSAIENYTDEWREVVTNINDFEDYDNSYDFTVDDLRFIHKDHIHEIMVEELSSDLYILGCFNANFLTDVTGWPQPLIEAGQKGEQYETIGQGIIDNNLVDDLAEEYAQRDGYGHHFAHYDSEENRVGDWYFFKIN